MDKRAILGPGTVLPFPGMECTIDSLAGCGSNAVVYIGHYPDQRNPKLNHRVLIKELFPYDPGGMIYRDENGNIRCLLEARDTLNLHRFSFDRGNEIHIRLLEEHPGDIDSNINSFSLNGTLYSILGFTGGRSLEWELERPNGRDIQLQEHIRRMLGVLNVLEAFHQSGFLHLDISPDNILLIGDGRRERITLIDYNSVHRIQEIREGKSVYYSAKEGYTAPEIRSGKTGDIGFGSDLYALTAVFYRCITGQRLTPMQVIRPTVPDVSESACLKGLPDTVLSMVRQILKKGLASLTGRRYKDTEQMRQDFEELEDRISGKGITHWALWENGRANGIRVVKDNPGWNYIKDEDQIYPVQGMTEDGETILLSDPKAWSRLAGAGPVLLLGSGGMGKTTALLRMAYQQGASYCATDPAVIYISLYGWENGRDSFIKDRILEHLRFKPHTDSMETAKHELISLLSAPLHTKGGDRPKLILLLDGLNEAVGDIGALLKEIEELSALAGVFVMASGRSNITDAGFRKIALKQLDGEYVQGVLAVHGLLTPGEQALFHLLQNPMMLSIFIQTALASEKQLLIGNREQLLKQYFSAMLEKEVRNLPADSARRWYTQAALYFVLPEIARLEHSKGTAVSDQALLPVIARCYKTLSGHFMTMVFPQWIGHIADLQGGAQNVDQWYGLMVLTVLWQRLGLIVKDEQGCYRIAHQLIREHLVEVQQAYHVKFVRLNRLRTGAAVVISAFFILVFYRWVYTPFILPAIGSEAKVYYDRTLSEIVVDTGFAAYIEGAVQYERVSNLLDCFTENGIMEEDYGRYLNQCMKTLEADAESGQSGNPQALALGYADALLASGEVMPWSGQAMNEDAYEAMVRIPGDRAADYRKYIEILDLLRQDEKQWNRLGEAYVKDLNEAVQADAFVLGKFYNMLLGPELDAMKNSESDADQQNYHLYMMNIALIEKQNAITQSAAEDPSAEIENYTARKKRAWEKLRANEAVNQVNWEGR